jgi:DNA invertase Pin-like site-specific DNA recombinase
VLDLRQSTPHHVLTNQESLRLPYALQPRALTLGWRPEAIAIIDADVGRSATAAQPREGCKALLTQVTLGQVGMILSYAVTRLSRHGSDGYPRLDICGYRRGFMADRDGVSAPATPHGRV